MNDIFDFLSPVNIATKRYYDSQLGHIISKYEADKPLPNLSEIKVALIGVLEGRGSGNNDACADGPNAIRQMLYMLNEHYFDFKIADLGNILPGKTLNDTLAAVKAVVSELLSYGITPIILGGGHHLTLAQYLAYEQLDNETELCMVDAFFDMDEPEEQEEVSNINFLNKILLHEPNYLYNVSVLGFQKYFVPAHLQDAMDKMLFDAVRLAKVSTDMPMAESYIRDADLMSFDITAIRGSDFRANANVTPNGLYAQEACQLMYYAGASDKLSSIGLYEYNPVFDDYGLSAQLLAQMIWCFLDGYSTRKNENPYKFVDTYQKFQTITGEFEIIFYKNESINKWWMQVPYPGKPDKYKLIGATQADYEQACNDEIPERWWKSYQRIY